MKTVEGMLKEIYKHSLEMLKHGETKNAALISFNGVIVILLIKMAVDFKDHWFLFYYFLFTIAVCCISIFLGLSSLVAQLKDYGDDLDLPPDANLLFFGNVAHFTPDDLIDSIKIRYGLASKDDNYERDLARSVVITAQIAKRKHRTFNAAIAWTFSGIATPLSVLVYHYFFNPNRK
ncbi:MAG TPA: Pycsar system effector family protein [Syntrophorhabdaceae bacterium]|jgi:hypothetical protein